MGWPVRVVTVRGPSMVPTVRDGDRLLVWFRRPRRTPSTGRVVLVALPDRPLSVKRLVAVESDRRIRVEGDNEFGSTDSRSLGTLAMDSLHGLVLVRLWPRPGRLPGRSGP